VTARRSVLLLVLVPSLLAACGPTGAQQGSIKLSCQTSGDTIDKAIVLMAQAVPSAAFVPCVKALPQGWTFGSFEARSGRVDLWFDSDRAGLHALHVSLVPSCAAGGTREPSDEPPADLSVRIQKLDTTITGTRTYRFPGACMMEAFRFPVSADTVLLGDTTLMIELSPRAALVAQLAKHGLHL
jgi:hypothetical protein